MFNMENFCCAEYHVIQSRPCSISYKYEKFECKFNMDLLFLLLKKFYMNSIICRYVYIFIYIWAIPYGIFPAIFHKIANKF
jgi:hypothetical protein